MTTTINPPNFFYNLFFRLGRGRRAGLCLRCERPTRWEDVQTHYRCSNCGTDPIEHQAEG